MQLVDDTQAVGSLKSRQGVILRPEISGRITQLNFQDGGRVKAGQLLVQLDDRLPMAQVQQALAELSIAEANQKRNQDLVAQNFISRRTLDESAAALQVAEAKLALARASAARLQILAPFDGLAGIRSVNLGDYLKDGADIVNIEDIEAIYVDYRLPERFQSKVRRGQTATVELDALPGRKFKAVLLAVDPLIDANGRSVGVRACIDNRRLQLRPGMFARVNTVFGQRDDARMVPEEAIVPQAGKQFVIRLLPEPDGQGFVTQRVEVKVGQRLSGQVEILNGVALGDSVVVAGQQRVQRDGTSVRVMEMAAGAAAAAVSVPVAPAASAAPKPSATALPPLTGPDPCLAGVAKTVGQAAKPLRKPS
jgi:membrane fusion protein (multidrug efflux system)